MKYLLSIVAISFSFTAFAQKLNLQDAISIALKNSLDIQVVKNNLEISSVNNYIGIAGGLPLVTGSASDNEQITDVNQKLNTGQIIQRKGTSANTINAGVTGSMLLYNGFRVMATKKRLEELQRQSEDYVNSQVQNTMAAVITGYFDVVRQQNYIKTINQSIEVAKQKLSVVQAQQSVGMANNADLFQAQLDLNTLLQSQQSQQLIIDQSKTELLRLMSLKADSLINVEDTIIVDKSVTLDMVLNSLHSNADIAAAEEQIKINDLIIKETAAQRYPSVRASMGYNYSRNQVGAGNVLLNQTNGPFVGLTVGIPIYNGSIYKRQQKVAEINSHNASLQKTILERDYSSAVVKSFQAYAAALQQLETAQKNYDLSQQLVKLVLQRFQLRQATIIDVKQAQQSFETAAYSLTNLSYAAKASEVELKRLSNLLK